MTNQRRRRTKVEEPEQDGLYLDKKFRIMPLDDLNVELQEYTKHEVKENKEKEIEAGTIHKWTWCSYHGSHKSAIRAYCILRCNRAKNENELMKIIADIHSKIDNLFEFKCDGKAKEKGCKCSAQT